MLNPQDVQDKKFAKAVFGGYDMAEVDDFLDQLGSDYEALFKESAVLKSKLKTLAEKIEDYRTVDDEMRKALIAAKRASDELLADARQKAEELSETARKKHDEIIAAAQHTSDDMLNNSRAQAETHLAEVHAAVLAEEARFARVREAMNAYANTAADACRRQLEALRALMSEQSAEDRAKAVASRIDIAAPTEPKAAPKTVVVPQPVVVPEPVAAPEPEPVVEAIPEVVASVPAEVAKAVASVVDAALAEATPGETANGDARIIGRRTASDSLPGSAPLVELVDFDGVTVNVTTLNLNEEQEDDAFRDIFSATPE